MKKYKRHPKYKQILVSKDGELKSTKTGVVYKLSEVNTGYLELKYTTGSRTDGSRKVLNLKVHRLVAETYIPNPDNLYTVNHKNGHKQDNRTKNLEWLSAGDNLRHSWKSGTHTGTPLSKEHRKKLTSAIREKWAKGEINRNRDVFGRFTSLE